MGNKKKGKKKESVKIPAPVVIIIGIFLLASAGGAATSKTVRHAVSSAIGSVKVTSASQKAFVRAVLADLHAPETSANISSLEAWLPHENTAAKNNPMASTMLEPGSTTFNYDGVQNYATPTEGAYATAATLADGYYPHIVAALKSGKGLCGNTSLAAEFLIWSGNGYSGVC